MAVVANRSFVHGLCVSDLAMGADRLKIADSAARQLLAYCQACDWAGYDPYDALNSAAFRLLPFLDSKVPRLALTQLLKRSPINVRRIALVPRTQNPKGLALFLTGLLKLSKVWTRSEDLVGRMKERLIALRSRGVPYWCWGYSFPWQTRASVVPAGVPNIVCTSFVANALLDVFEDRRDSQCLQMAASAAEYMLNELYWTEGAFVAGFGYPLPSQRLQVHNANLLASALLCRVHRHTGETRYLEAALRVTRCTVAKQRKDGSWPYGEAAAQGWIDNFHTGYNLCALRSIGEHAGTTEFDRPLRRGFEFYRTHFFREDGAARYFHDRTYPIDTHCVAQSIITLTALRDLHAGNVPLAHAVLDWTMDHLWDPRGFFYYRQLRFCTIRISYMRWSQAWMFLALATLLRDSRRAVRNTRAGAAPALAAAC
jgi:hypothetical protein